MDLTATGRLLYGRYRLLTVIGRGSTGVVWRARDELLERDVAVKELVWPPDFTAPQQQAADHRALREAQLTSRLAHQNVVLIYDILQEDGHPWIIMELLPYQSLRDQVRAEGPLTPVQAAKVGLGVLAALRTAHAAGVLHQDVKPANIFAGPDGRIVLTDFGIAGAFYTQTPTTADALAGSPSCLAPEQASGGQPSPATDLWGLGVSLYTAVEGRPPFERDDELSRPAAAVTDDPAAAVRAGPLWPVISGLLRTDPNERLDAAQTEGMLRDALDSAASAPETLAPEAPAPAPPADPAPHPRRSSRLAGALVALSALAVAAIALAFAVTSWPGHPTALSGGISPAASSTAKSLGSLIPGPSTIPSLPASGSTASATTAPANPSAPPALTPSGGAVSAPANAPTSPTASPSSGSALPAGYYRLTNPTGFSIGVPDGWQVSNVGNYVYITDPSNNGIFLLIDQSDTPKPNPLADWQQQAANRAGTYPDYRLIRLAAVSYAQAEKAADWEFTYVRDGIPVRILNRNVLANAHHAYALYWSTPETDWNADYHYFEAFADTFQPAP
jgi:eukaryotic-like serine/threonine-protein kinase